MEINDSEKPVAVELHFDRLKPVKKEKEFVFLSINRCPIHKFWSVSLDHGGGGVRLTASKCCGRWNTIKQFKMGSRDLDEMAIEALNLKEIAEENE